MSADRPAKGLGMGLSALLGEARPADAPPAEGVREIEVARIRPNPNQPRVHFDEDSIAELADSIRQRGVLQPILRADGEEFEIIAGERRWRAAQRARLHTIPAIVREIDEATTAELALIENIQREDLNAIEEAQGYKQLIERQTNDYAWQFLYLGADQDAVEVGMSIGVGAGHSVTYGRGKVKQAMAATAANVSAYRDARAAGMPAPMAAKATEFTETQRRDAAG